MDESKENQGSSEQLGAATQRRKARRYYTETEERMLLAIALPLRHDPDAYDAMARRLNRPRGGIVSKRNDLLREQRRRPMHQDKQETAPELVGELPVKHHHGAMLEDLRALTRAVVAHEEILVLIANGRGPLEAIGKRLARLESSDEEEPDAVQPEQPEEDDLARWRRG